MRLKHARWLASCGLGLLATPASATTNDTLQIATDAYIYGYSLLTTDVTRELY